MKRTKKFLTAALALTWATILTAQGRYGGCTYWMSDTYAVSYVCGIRADGRCSIVIYDNGVETVLDATGSEDEARELCDVS